MYIKMMMDQMQRRTAERRAGRPHTHHTAQQEIRTHAELREHANTGNHRATHTCDHELHKHVIIIFTVAVSESVDFLCTHRPFALFTRLIKVIMLP